MITINDLNLKDTKSIDCPHLLLWDSPNNFEITKLLFNNNAQLISYRDNLLKRIKPQQKFLILHQKLDQELESIKHICRQANKPIVLLKDLDYLITYLYTIPNVPISLFWNKLAHIRHLERTLWIILPTKLKPDKWNENRIKTIM